MDTLISLLVLAVSLHLVAGGVGGVVGDCGAAWVYDNSTGYCYNFANTTGSWFVARSRCHGLGAQLASIHSLHEQSFIQERLTYTVRSPALWIGLNSLNTGAGFAWDDGTGLGFLNWSPGEPNNMGKNEHCGEIVAAGPTKGKWNDIICTSQSKFICKKKSAGFTTAPPTTRAPVSAGMAYACPDSSWKSYKDSCYLFLHNITGVNWNTSWSQCVNQGANLASINDESEQNFVFSQLPNTASGYSDQYWLGLNDIHHQMAFEWTDASHVTFTNWAGGEPSNSWRENCVSVHKQDGRWSDERCDRPKTGYICKAAQTPVPTTPSPVILDDSCPREDDVAYGYKCYTFVTSSMTWDAAMWNCERKGSTLAAIQNRWEQAFLASQVSVMSAYFWIGLSDIGNGDLEWANNATVDFTAWSANHTGNENDTCVAMQNTTPGVGLWVNLNCSVDLYYICESPRAGFSTPFVPTTTTTAPLVCPAGWHIYNAYCYKSYSGLSDKVSFFKARGRCRSMGADLVSLHSSAEERFVFSYRVTSSFSSTYWIGLNDLDSEMGHKWTDGTPFTYKNWGYREPNDKAGTDDCVERTYRWNDNNCYVANGYVCKIPLGKELTIPPSTAPTLHPPCGSVSGWLVYNGSCYYASGTSKATWYDARVYCMKEGGDLASVHSQPEYGFVLALMTRTSSRTCWLGATAVGVNTFGWTDGSLWDYDNWGNGEPNDAFGSEKCGQISQRSGYWNDHNCNEKYNYLCKKPLGDTPPVTVPPTPVLPGNCPPNFTRVAMDNTCYGIFGRTTGGLNYTSAVDACRDMGTMGEYDIASIGSRTALAQLIVMMNALGTNNAGIWIGLNDLDKSYRYTWQDNRPLALTNWGRGQPSSRYYSRSRCVVMNTGRRRAGKWRTVECGSVRPYVCSTTPNTTYAVHPPSRDCAIPGYTSNGQNCYKLHTLPLTWQQAVDACRHDHANMASILSVYEQAYVDVKTLYIDTPVWIGLGDTKTTGTYTWVDMWPVYYSHWARGEPSYTPGSGCVVTDGGYWNDTRCNDTHPFLCKSTYVTPPTPTAYPSGYCKDRTWKQFSSYCYFLSLNVKYSWAEAEFDCTSRGMHLASIHGQHELMFVLGLVDAATTDNSNIWIGYRRIAGYFTWYDGSSTGYVNWAASEPAGPGTTHHKDCAQLQQESGTWKVTTCSTTNGYICKTPKVPATSKTTPSSHFVSSTTSTISAPSLPRSSNTPPQSRMPIWTHGPKLNTRGPTLTGSPQHGGSQDLSAGQIAGIFIGALLALLVVCAVLFYIKRKPDFQIFSSSRKTEAQAFENVTYGNGDVFIEPNDKANGIMNGGVPLQTGDRQCIRFSDVPC